MTATIEAKPWDLSHVLDLVNSLSFKTDPFSVHDRTNDTQNAIQSHDNAKEDDDQIGSIDRKDFAPEAHGLGDFSKLWQYLGSPLSTAVPTPAVHDGETEQPTFSNKRDYASDGATYVKTPSTHNNATRWPGQGSSDEQADTVSDGSAVPETPTLTKTQRKKRNRKERRAKDAALAAEQASKKASVGASESEADDIWRKTPAKKASSHVISTPQNNQYSLRQRDPSGKAITSIESDPLVEAAAIAAQRVDAAKKATAPSSKAQQDATPSRVTVPGQEATTGKHNAQLHQLPSHNGHVSAYNSTQPKGPRCWQWLTPQKKSTHVIPSSVQPPTHSATRPVSMHQYSTANQNTAPPKSARVIEPLIVRSGEDRHWALLIKLIGDFYEDRKHLISPMNLTNHSNDPKGIHVFVDASNIFIGFNDQLKRSRGIAPWIQVPPVDLSFDALALLMERRRPVAKRVLVGSTPHLPAFDKAKAVGYECNILEKVYKARELTDRQIYFKELDTGRRRAKAPPANSVATLNGGHGSGSGSGSETNAPQYAPARMIEQGVDEILHLKILESVVDTEAPGTMVLATGDAAQAEYSQGFMAMAERALKKGWTVELVSWSKNISTMYKRREWVQAWRERFRIVMLDDYAEELLDM